MSSTKMSDASLTGSDWLTSSAELKEDHKSEEEEDDSCSLSETMEVSVSVEDIADAPPDEGGFIDFNVVNYNCFLFPESMQTTGQKGRRKLIPKKVSQINDGNVDVFCFSEVWGLPYKHTHSERIAQKMKKLGWKYTTGVLKNKGSITGVAASVTSGIVQVLDGGLLLCSKHKIVRSKSMIYPTKASTSNEDSFSAKGVWYARIKKQGMYFNVFGTHLQSGRKGKRLDEKKNQIKQLKKFIQKQIIPDKEPIILCGDLNIRKDSTDYDEFITKLDVSLPEIIGELSTTTGDSTISAKSESDAARLWVEISEGIITSSSSLSPCIGVGSSSSLSSLTTIDTSTSSSSSSSSSSSTTTTATIERKMDRCYSSPFKGTQYLDFIFFSNQHLKPLHCSIESQRSSVTLSHSEVIKVKHWHKSRGATFDNRIIDLSDHLPILGRFRFEDPMDTDDDGTSSSVAESTTSSTKKTKSKSKSMKKRMLGTPKKSMKKLKKSLR